MSKNKEYWLLTYISSTCAKPGRPGNVCVNNIVIDKDPLDWIVEEYEESLRLGEDDNVDKWEQYKSHVVKKVLLNAHKITKKQYDKAYKATEGYQDYGFIDYISMGKER